MRWLQPGNETSVTKSIVRESTGCRIRGFRVSLLTPFTIEMRSSAARERHFCCHCGSMPCNARSDRVCQGQTGK